MVIFYPTISRGELGKHCNASRMLLVASSFAADQVLKYGHVRKKIPVPTMPKTARDIAADCGGFVSTFKWKTYRYTPYQYVAWLRAWATPPAWAATMDFCCEDEIIAGKSLLVRERQQRTTGMAYKFWYNFRDVPWAWVPTIQGWTIEDYQRHATEMKPLISEMQAHYGENSAFRVGIGTLCHRASSEMIQDVVLAVAAILQGVPLHLWGVKLGLAQSKIAIPEQVVSIDSAAWNGMFGHGRNRWKGTGKTQRQWCFDTGLPEYDAKLDAALTGTKQARMF